MTKNTDTLIQAHKWSELLKSLDQGEHSIGSLTPETMDSLASVAYRFNARAQEPRFKVSLDYANGIVKLMVR